ncbi:hypothetical protein HF086_015765 [Spodoptera exigua]|uniref:Uncharacterized protein n=1 Tax=Spodoptera exigua TaxID=7107 RepID=A0A922S8Q6_SPOEX|nr:hypothetical protein HF086_015765 [Spodoptera exigua]
MEQKAEELQVLAEMRREGDFTPRKTLARTPPQGFSTPMEPVEFMSPQTPLTMQAEKRLLSSPEEVQEAVRRRLGAKRGRNAEQPAAAAAEQPKSGLAAMTKTELIERAYEAVKIISGVANAANKLNMADKTAISGQGQDILAVVAALNVRLAEAEHEVTAMKLRVASMELTVATAGVATQLIQEQGGQENKVINYASVLKLLKGKPPLESEPGGRPEMTTGACQAGVPICLQEIEVGRRTQSWTSVSLAEFAVHFKTVPHLTRNEEDGDEELRETPNQINLWHQFSFCELTINMGQQNGAEFIDLRVRELTTSQLESLCERRRIPLTGDFADGYAVRIFPTVKQVDDYNDLMTGENSKLHKVYTITAAVDESREVATYGKTPPSNVIPRDLNNCSGLFSTLKLAEESRVMLR